MVVLIDSPDFKLLGPHRVVKQSDVSAVVEATDVLNRAQAILASAEENCQKRFETAMQEGLKAGLAQASNQMAEQLSAAMIARQASLNDLSSMLADIVADTMQSMLKQIDANQIYQSAIDTVNRLIKRAQWVELRVNPSHVKHAQHAVDSFATDINTSAYFPFISVIADNTLNEYACVFQTDIGIADASLDVQLDFIRQAVLNSITQHTHHLTSEKIPLDHHLLQSTLDLAPHQS